MHATTTPEANGYKDGQDISLNTAAMLRAVNTGLRVILDAKVYTFNENITPTNAQAPLLIKGQGTAPGNSTTIQIVHQNGIALQPKGQYEIEGVIIHAPSKSIGIGSRGSEYSAPRSFIKNSYIAGGVAERIGDGIWFDEKFEHPLGLTIDQVYIQNFLNSGCTIGGAADGGPGSSIADGESAIHIGRLIIVGSAAKPPEVPISVNSTNSTEDLITWTEPAERPRFGYILLRKRVIPIAATEWEVSPTQTGPIKGTTQFRTKKNAGEAYEYMLRHFNVGLKLHRLKAVSANTLQSEYVGVGSWFENVIAVNINTHYTEQRGDRMTGTLSSIYLKNSFANVGTMWTEGTSYAVICEDSVFSYQVITCAKQTVAAIGLIETTRASRVAGGTTYFSNVPGSRTISASLTGKSSEYNCDHLISDSTGQRRKIDGAAENGIEIFYRGQLRGHFKTGGANGHTTLVTQKALISAPDKNLQPPIVNSTNDNWSTLSGSPAVICRFTVPMGGVAGVSLLIHLRVSKTSPNLLSASFVTRAEVSAISGSTSKAEITSTTTSAGDAAISPPTFTTAMSGSTVSISCGVPNLIGLKIEYIVLPIAATGIDTALTQI